MNPDGPAGYGRKEGELREGGNGRRCREQQDAVEFAVTPCRLYYGGGWNFVCRDKRKLLGSRALDVFPTEKMGKTSVVGVPRFRACSRYAELFQ